MLDNNYRMISRRYSREDYLHINLKVDSPQTDWDYAIEIFEDRFVGRYFNVIDLLEKHLLDYGFAIMSLNCLLIEALMQFRKGYPETPDGKNRKEYKDFLKYHLGFKSFDARRFYEEIRCGLLHSAETKKGSYFKIKSNKLISYGMNNVLYVDINQVTLKIREYFVKYCSELREQDNPELRKNFIKKMDDITLKYEGYEEMNEIWYMICSYNEAVEFNISRGKTFKIILPMNSNDHLKIKSNYAGNIIIDKDDVIKAIYYWPSKNAINTLTNGEYIFAILEKCKERLKRFEEMTA